MTRILVLNFFPAFTPPGSGGELRYFNLYNELSRHFDITLLSPTYSHHSAEVVKHTESFREYRVPKEPVHEILHGEIGREGISPEISALVCALSARYPNKYHRTYLELYPAADFIVHEFPYMVEYDLFFGIDKKPRIYNSHNLESSLVEQVWRGKHAAKYIDYIRLLERRLVAGCDLCFAVSEEEKERFIEDFNVAPRKMAVAPNGIHPVAGGRAVQKERGRKRPSALFLGSFHPPNITAAEFIINNLADRCPDIDFIIAGACMRGDKTTAKSNVRVLGKVSDEEKKTLLADVDLAVNPMFTGAGTNLKVLEYLAHGIPTIATARGGRGLNLTDGEHCLIAGKDDFASKLRGLAFDEERLARLSEQGKAFVEKNFSWESIASQVAVKIGTINLSNHRNERKTLFVLNDFEVNSPVSGGEIRINRIYSQLSKRHDVILLCLNNTGLIRRTDITDSFVQLSIPKTEEHLCKEAEMNSGWWVSVNDIVASICAPENDLLGAVAGVLHQICDAVIAVHPYMIRLLDGKEGKPLIYESLNCEYDLKKYMLQGHPHYGKMVDEVKRCETLAISRSRLIISVSDFDHANLKNLSKERKLIYTIPNGIDIGAGSPERGRFPELLKLFQGNPVIVFIGSGHKPNLDCVDFIKARLAPSMARSFFLVIGTVCDAFRNRVPKNVLLCGKVDEESKKVLMSLASVAINPVSSGSGSNLKLAEYLAGGIPVVTTPFGARGYGVENGREVVICELSRFKSEICRLLEDPERQSALAENAYRYAKDHLDWQHHAHRYDEVLQREIFHSPRKRMLVVTYRFTDPPLGGAEVHLLELLKKIESTGDFDIDVATTDIKTITNQFHFSCAYTYDPDGPVPSDLPWTRVYRFKTDCLPDRDKLSNARLLFKQWMQEFRESSLRHLAKYPFPMLLGGWYYPEYTQSDCEIWTSDEALLFVPRADALVLRGFHPKRTSLRCIGDQQVLFSGMVKGEFEIRFPLLNHSVLKLLIENLVDAKNDPRTLGIRVKSLSYEIAGQAYDLRLDYDYKTYLKQNFIDLYIDELIQTANSRPHEFDELFQKTRGPLSAALEDWLDHNIERYDLILGHSVPFSTLVMASRYANKYSKPIVLMPDFHIDDEFYHWNSYYNALQQGSELIVFPRAASELFFDKIGCKSKYVPPGINMNEPQSVEDDLLFDGLYQSTLPYVLVLGRKDRTKNYDLVAGAIRKINCNDRICNMVLIGRDEDGIVLDPNEVLYLGGQPRGVVLSALRNSLCLVSMSESESFGIVILEAWAQKRPVIVSMHCIAYTELVDEGVNGLYASKDNLNEKVMYLLDNAMIANDMGLNGYRKVLKTFTWNMLWNDLYTLLNNMV